ncbi:MAG TPA: hypothetical protein VGR57_17535 [Ktedonobacterales bacterium]|nr:hypothetical protein [Ktedonobacterales bacterium]
MPFTESDRLSLAEASFKAISEAESRIENKGGQVLAAMAFLTAAAAAIFAAAYAPGALRTGALDILGWKFHVAVVAVFAFSAYVFLVLLGAALHIAALGPTLTVDSWRRSGAVKTLDDQPRSQVEQQSQDQSLLYFEAIAGQDLSHWQSRWSGEVQSLESLQKAMVQDLIRQAHLTAQRGMTKNFLMALGREFFRFSLFFLNMLTASLFAPTPRWFVFWTLLGGAGLSAVFAIENWMSPPREDRIVSHVWAGAAILLIILLVVFGAHFADIVWLVLMPVALLLLTAIFVGVRRQMTTGTFRLLTTRRK